MHFMDLVLLLLKVMEMHTDGKNPDLDREIREELKRIRNDNCVKQTEHARCVAGKENNAYQWRVINILSLARLLNNNTLPPLIETAPASLRSVRFHVHNGLNQNEIIPAAGTHIPLFIKEERA